MGTEMEKVSHLIPGFHAVKETLLNGETRIKALWIATGKHSPRIEEILHIAKKKGISVQFKKSAVFDNLLPDMAHQGIVALAEKFTYIDLDHIIHISLKDPGYALIVAADHITDEGNLGALIRAAVFFDVQGLILPKDRSAKVTEKVKKRSSGAYIHLPIARVVNMGRTLDILSKKGFWIIGTAEEGHESIYEFDWKRDLVLIFGSEDRGLSHSVRNRCHELVRIPAKGHLTSLNVAVASGIILSEVIRQRTQVNVLRS